MFSWEETYLIELKPQPSFEKTLCNPIDKKRSVRWLQRLSYKRRIENIQTKKLLDWVKNVKY